MRLLVIIEVSAYLDLFCIAMQANRLLLRSHYKYAINIMSFLEYIHSLTLVGVLILHRNQLRCCVDHIHLIFMPIVHVGCSHPAILSGAVER